MDNNKLTDYEKALESGNLTIMTCFGATSKKCENAVRFEYNGIEYCRPCFENKLKKEKKND